MSDQSAAPPRGGGPISDISRFARKNKLLAGGAVAAGAVVFLSRKGAASGGGDAPAGGDAGTYGQIVPVMQPMSEGDDTAGYAGGGDGTGEGAELPPDNSDLAGAVSDLASAVDNLEPSGTDTADPTPVQPAGQPAQAPPAAGGTASGVTVQGRFFAGATQAIRGSNGSDANGKFHRFRIVYPGSQEELRLYYSGKLSGQWVGSKAGTTRPKAPAAKAPAHKAPAKPKHKAPPSRPQSPAASPKPKPTAPTVVRRGREYYNGTEGNCRSRPVTQYSDGSVKHGDSVLEHKHKCERPGIRWA